MIRLNLSVLGEIRCYRLGTRSVCEKVNQISKRGSMLADMVADKDKKKKWYFHILKNTPKSKNVFEKVHRPKKRQEVLNSLFIQNISDVLSTGDVAPEFIGSGIEITGVKVSPSCQDVIVYWEIPPSKYSNDEDLAKLLNIKAPKLRAELISRNVLGYVPQIHFVRDTSNAYMAAFEKALEQADFGPENTTSIVPEDTFTKRKKIYTFKVPKECKIKENVTESLVTNDQYADTPPPRPLDMKNNVFGLDQDHLMKKLVTLKTTSKSSTSPNVIVHPKMSEDLFSKIPGTTIDGFTNREKLLTEFHIQRKMLRNRKENKSKAEDHFLTSHDSNNQEEHLDYVIQDDFIEEETSEKF